MTTAGWILLSLLILPVFLPLRAGRAAVPRDRDHIAGGGPAALLECRHADFRQFLLGALASAFRPVALSDHSRRIQLLAGRRYLCACTSHQSSASHVAAFRKHAHSATAHLRIQVSPCSRDLPGDRTAFFRDAHRRRLAEQRPGHAGGDLDAPRLDASSLGVLRRVPVGRRIR